MSDRGEKRKGDRNGSGGNKKGKYGGFAKKSSSIERGMRGILMTCETRRERKSANELIDVLNELYEEMRTKTPENNPAATEDKGVAAALETEMAELREQKKTPRFKIVGDAMGGMAFIEMRKDEEGEEGPTPTELTLAIVRDVAANKESKSRYIMRMLPVETVAFASKEEILKALEPFLKKNFPTAEDPSTIEPIKYAVLFEARQNNSVKRMEVIDAIANSIPKPHKVDINNADKTIMVQINRGNCLIAVLEDYPKLAKYNLHTLCLSDEERQALKTGVPGPGPKEKEGVATKEPSAKEETDKSEEVADVAKESAASS